MTFKDFAPLERKLDFIALRPGAPHGRTFTFIEHAELQGSGVGNQAGITSKSIYLFDYLTFSYPSNCRIATHFCKSGHIHRNKKDGRTHVCSCHRGFATGVTAPHYYDVVTFFHHLTSPQMTGRKPR